MLRLSENLAKQDGLLEWTQGVIWGFLNKHAYSWSWCEMAGVFLATLYEYSPLFYISVVSLCFVVTAAMVLGW